MARILIVDTQSELRHQLVRLLEQADHSATAVATVSEAAGILSEDAPDLLATNVVLIDGSGIGLARQAEAAGAKILMLTGGRTGSSSLMVLDNLPVEAVCARSVLATGPGDTFFRLASVWVGPEGGAGSKRETIRGQSEAATHLSERFPWSSDAEWREPLTVPKAVTLRQR